MMIMIKKMQDQAMAIFDLYGVLRGKQGQRQWTREETIHGFMGDVGDLAKLSMVKAGVRGFDDEIDEKIAHELTDCLWSVLVLAKQYNVDLESEFPKTMEMLEEKIKRKIEKQ